MILQLSDIHYSVGDTSILNGVSFEVPEGQSVGIIGPNGSGKTTLFNCISGFNQVSAGSILFRGKEISSWDPHQRAQVGIGRTFQNFGIFREMTVIENMLAALDGRGSWLSTLLPWTRSSKENVLRAKEYLSQVKLLPKAHDKASSLSGGQMRLLEIIRALAYGAELFLLDEPTAGVSPKMKDEVIELIRSLIDAKKTVVVIEHDINFIQQFCSRIIVLNEGKVLLDGTPEVVRQDRILSEIYFGRSREHATP